MKIEWDQLEMVFEQSSDDVTAYLDRQTGEVVSWSPLLGDDEGLAERVDEGEPGRYLHVEPPDAREHWRWMQQFSETVSDRALCERLLSAIAGKGAFRRFKQEIEARPAIRERWFAFRAEKMEGAIREWLADSDLPVERPRRNEPKRRSQGVRYSTDADEIDLDRLASLFDEAGWQKRTVDRERLAGMLHGSGRVAAAWDGEDLLGFARAVTDEAFNAYISTVVVASSHRRRGIGRALVELLLESGEHLQFVLHTRPEARAFYEKLGFVAAPEMMWRPRRR